MGACSHLYLSTSLASTIWWGVVSFLIFGLQDEAKRFSQVQVGFGRIGLHFWAFELYGVVPDMVTLGKPIGNGFPMGAVVTTPALAHGFARGGMEYFNTCGGCTAAGAAGIAVLRVCFVHANCSAYSIIHC